jgi:hypothetical protein
LENPIFRDPLPLVKGPADLPAFVRRRLAGRPRDLDFLIGSGLSKDTVRDPLFEALFRCGVSEVDRWACWYDVRVRVEGLHYDPDFRLADTREQALAILKDAARRKLPGLRLGCAEPLFRQLSAEGYREAFALAHEAGFSSRLRARASSLMLLYGETEE